MINIKSYTKTKNSNGSATGSSTVTVKNINAATTADRLTKTHTFWGNEFNGTQDVEGDLTLKDKAKLTVGGPATFKNNIFCKGNSTIDGDLTVKRDAHFNAADFDEEITVNGDLVANSTSYFNGLSHFYSDVDTRNLTCSEKITTQTFETTGDATVGGELTTGGDATIGGNLTNKGDLTVEGTSYLKDTSVEEFQVNKGATIQGGQTVYGKVTLDDTLTVAKDATFKKDISVLGTGNFNNLNVTGTAHFFNLIIDEVKSVGGQIVISCANGKIEKVKDPKTQDASSVIEEYIFKFYDADGNILVDPESMTELRIVRGTGGTDAATWKTFVDKAMSKTTTGYITDGAIHFTENVWCEQSYNTDTPYLSLFYNQKETWNLLDEDELYTEINYAAETINPLINVSEYNSMLPIGTVTTQRVMWKAEGANQFICGDHILCHKFNILDGDTAISKHYWTPCMTAGSIDGYNYVDLLTGFTQNTFIYNTVNGWKVEPEMDDNLVQLGHVSDTTRQNAIVISSYAENVLDSRQSATDGLKAPYFAQYQGINNYTLKDHALTYFSNGQNHITGNLYVESNKSVTDYINDKTKDLQQLKTYVAYCNDPTVSGKPSGFTINPVQDVQYNYMSIINVVDSVQPTDYTKYKDNWFRISGIDVDTTQYRLVPVEAYAVADLGKTDEGAEYKNLDISLNYKIAKIKGTSVEYITSIDDHTVSVRWHFNDSEDYKELTVSACIFSYNDTTAFTEDQKQIVVEFLIDNAIIATDTVDITISQATIFNLDDGITLAVSSITKGLEDTGINIQDKKIYFTSDNFFVRNNQGVTTMTIDKDGNLETNNAKIIGNIEATSGTFKGTVNATDGTFNGTITATNGNIGPFAIDSEGLKSTWSESSNPYNFNVIKEGFEIIKDKDKNTEQKLSLKASAYGPAFTLTDKENKSEVYIGRDDENYDGMWYKKTYHDETSGGDYTYATRLDSLGLNIKQTKAKDQGGQETVWITLGKTETNDVTRWGLNIGTTISVCWNQFYSWNEVIVKNLPEVTQEDYQDETYQKLVTGQVYQKGGFLKIKQ